MPNEHNLNKFKIITAMFKTIFRAIRIANYSNKVAQPLRSKKPKSDNRSIKSFVDLRQIRAVGGKGGNGCIAFLHLWSNEYAGPSGGDGGNGGHVIFKSSTDVRDLIHLDSVIQGENGEKGLSKDCIGKSGEHVIVNVPIGTVIKDINGKVVGDLSRENLMFVAARGGAGGKGNHYFVSPVHQTPEICEYGAEGEDINYIVEIRSMAHIGLIGFPNAGKSTLLRAITRARPKVAPYPFTTLKPYVGVIQYDDYEQVAVADLPGLIPDSHKNKGLGIQFLRHAERCMGLLYILDMSLNEPWLHLESLQYELSQFNENLQLRPQLIIANKMDLAASVKNFELLKTKTDLKIIAVSAKLGTNLTNLLQELRIIYDEQKVSNSVDLVNE